METTPIYTDGTIICALCLTIYTNGKKCCQHCLVYTELGLPLRHEILQHVDQLDLEMVKHNLSEIKGKDHTDCLFEVASRDEMVARYENLIQYLSARQQAVLQ